MESAALRSWKQMDKAQVSQCKPDLWLKDLKLNTTWSRSVLQQRPQRKENYVLRACMQWLPTQPSSCSLLYLSCSNYIPNQFPSSRLSFNISFSTVFYHWIFIFCIFSDVFIYIFPEHLILSLAHISNLFLSFCIITSFIFVEHPNFMTICECN